METCGNSLELISIILLISVTLNFIQALYHLNEGRK
jgi:hypothetical protein